VGIPFRLVKAFDVNTIANQVYLHNFGMQPQQGLIEPLSASEFDGRADVWLMSPPCQPYTRGGKQLDAEDTRAAGLLHLCDIIKELAHPPRLLFLENVRCFEKSQSHKRLMDALHSQHYAIEQFIVTPSQLGIPNTRVRYYCIAIRSRDLTPEASPGVESMAFEMPAVDGREIPADMGRVGDYVERKGRHLADLLIDRNVFTKNETFLFDVACEDTRATTTFTKGYGRNEGRAGPILLCDRQGRPLPSYPPAQQTIQVNGPSVDSPEDCRIDGTLVSMETYRHVIDTHVLDTRRFRCVCVSCDDEAAECVRYRYFSPREMLRVHGFPEKFAFPACVTTRQQYGLIGNSISIPVVAHLLQYALHKCMLLMDGEGRAGS